jgi:hypothetical protein
LWKILLRCYSEVHPTERVLLLLLFLLEHSIDGGLGYVFTEMLGAEAAEGRLLGGYRWSLALGTTVSGHGESTTPVALP